MKPAVMAKGCLLAAIILYLLAVTQEYPRFLLFAQHSNLWHAALSDDATVSASLKIPLTEYLSRPIALDYNLLDEKIYWTDVGLNTISRAFLNGSSQETIVSTRLSYANGLAVDPFGQNVYWTDRYEDVIEVASLNGQYRRVLINDDLQYPSDIVLDVTRGLMYWTHSQYWSQKPKIERADMDGRNRRIAIHLGCYGDAYPSGLALDVTKNWLYWVDRYHDKLEVYEFPSKTRREIIPSHGEAFLSNPMGLALFGNHLFWADSNWNGIYRADRETGENVEEVLSTQYYPMSVHAYDKSKTITPVTDQCNNNNGGCSQLCLLTPLGRKCLCTDGLVLKDDGKTCHAPAQFLLFADATNRRIMKVSPQDSGSLTSLPLSNSLSRPVAIAYDFVEDRVYWTDIWRSTIARSFLNGSSQETIIYGRLDWAHGLAVDVNGRNLYWADTNKLEVSKLNGSYRKALITTDLYYPRDIILDVNKGMMYWTNWNNNPKIEKAEMTGKKRVVIVSSGLQQPNGLTLDHNNNRLYWVDDSYRTLEYLDLNQNNRVTLLSSYYVLRSPFGLTLLGDNLYWTDTQERAVYRANKETGGNVTKFIASIGQPMDIHGYNLTEYSNPANSFCQLNNGGCSHICLLSSSGGECACPSHLSLREDGKTCYYKYDFQKFLLFADGYYTQSKIFLFPLDGSNTEAKPLPLEISMYWPVALGLDIIETRIYWTDADMNTISRVFINGSSPEVIVRNVYNSYGLAVDPLGRNIYWTDPYANKIEVSRMDGMMRKTLIDQDLDAPRDIILDTEKGLMFWCEVGTQRKIEVANMDGDKRQMLVRRGLYYPNGLTLDDTKNRLYWVDSWFHTLEYYDLQSHKITTLIDSYSILSYPFGLTSLDGHLYWTDWYRSAVFQVNKTTPPNATILVSGLSQPMDIHAYDRNKTLPVHNCSLSFGGCSHLCLLKPHGGYRCSCPDGFILLEDGKTCKNHTNDFQRFILFADGYYSHAGIFLFPLDSSTSRAKPLVIDLDMNWSMALGLDITENRIYWTDYNTISRVFLNGSSPEVIVSGNFYDSYGLAVDPLGRNIYWTDSYANKIEVSRMDGTMRKTLIDQDLDNPRDIILDLNEGLMYWCEVGTPRKIEVANMDGDKRQIVVRRGLYYPTGLTLDETKNRLYWVDSWFHALEYYDLQSHKITTLIDSYSILPYPFGLTSLDGHLYWTDWSFNAVYQVKDTTPSNSTVLVSGLSAPMDIHAYDRNKTLPDHPCSSSNGGCSHLCLLRPDGYLCSCPDYLQPGDVCISSSVVLPFSSTPINAVSNSNYRTKSKGVSSSSTSVLTSSSSRMIQSTPHMKTPLFSTLPSASHINSIIPSEASTTILIPPTKTEQQTTVLSTCKPPTSAGTTTCQPNTCKNGGTCVIPGNYCKCEKIFAWHDCSVYVGSSTVEIELAAFKKNQWNLLDFKIALATACTEFFCKTGECTSKSRSGRVKRSEGATFFQPSDIVIPGISSGGENTWKVEFAALFPSADGPALQPMHPVEIIHMVNENKGTIEKAVGGTIKRITTASEVEPDQPTKGAALTQDKGISTIWIAAGVGSIVVAVIIVVAFVICRMRRKRRSNERKTSTMRLGNNVTGNTEFDNPAFDEDSIYDSISRARGISMATNLEQANNGGLQELAFRNDTGNKKTNKAPYDDRTYQALDKTAITNPAYAVACSGGHGIDNPGKRYASLQQKKEKQSQEYPGRGRRSEDPEKRCAALQENKEHPRRGGEAGHPKNEIPKNNFAAETDEDIYENLNCKDESGA